MTITENIALLCGKMGCSLEAVNRELDSLVAFISKNKDLTSYFYVHNLIRLCYVKTEFEFRLNDAKNHAKEMGFDLTDEDVREIALEFFDKYDCNIDENSQFENLIYKYTYEKEK